MGPLLLLAVVVVLALLALLAVRSLWVRGAGPAWWASLAACGVVGFGLGVWFGFCFEYRPSPKIRVIGCPAPVVVFVLESYPDGQQRWTDFVPAVPVLFALADVAIFSFASVYPVWIANSLWRRWRTPFEPTSTSGHCPAEDGDRPIPRNK